MMAATSRSDRQLMRQRGAGTRSVTSADFELDIKDGRQQRQLMRQRGAGNRNIENVDFGLAFAGPSQSRKSRSKTPQTINRPSSRSSKTPARSSREPSLPRDQQSTATRAKRRKIGEDQHAANATYSTREPLQDLRQPNASLQDIQTFSENSQDQPSPVEEENSQFALEPNPAFAVTNDGMTDKENVRLTSAFTKGPSKRKKRKSVGQQSLRRKNRVSSGSQRESVLPSVETLQEESVDNNTLHVEQDVAQDEEYQHNSSLQPRSSGQPTGSANQNSNTNAAKKRKKRKSIVLGRKKRRSSGNTTQSIIQEEEEATANLDESDKEGEAGADGVQLRSSSLAPQPRRRTMPTRFDSEEPPWQQTEADEDADETYMPDEATPEPTPAPKRKRVDKKTSSEERSDSQPPAKRTKSSFPVLTHRISNVQALPTITEGNEDDENVEGNGNIPVNFSNRPNPNGVDVLAQICRETIATAIEKMENNRDSSVGRAELKRKRTALEAFGSNLDDRLFDMSQAVEQRLTLESRLRKSKRDKADLQARWIEVRRQREQLALKCDTIRRQHWEDEERAKRGWEISEAAMKAEMELERGDGEEQQESLKFMILSLTADVSQQSEKGGVLNQVKAFNAQLETLATSLERR